MSEWNPLSTYFEWTWSFLQNLLVSICAKLPIYHDKAWNQLVEKICNNTRNFFLVQWKYMYVIILGRDMVACMQYAPPYEWNNRTIQTSFSRNRILPLKQMLCRKKVMRLNFITMYCTYSHVVFLQENVFCFMAILFAELTSLYYRQMPRKIIVMRLNPIKGCIAFFDKF